MSIEYHGDGVKTLIHLRPHGTWPTLPLKWAPRMPYSLPMKCLKAWFGEKVEGCWADPDAIYLKDIEINLDEVFPVVAAPHHVDNVKAVSEVQGTKIHAGADRHLHEWPPAMTCGRPQKCCEGKKLPKYMQMLIIPASKEIYMQAMKEGLIEIFIEAGANVLASSCGPCLGTGQGIPADDTTLFQPPTGISKGEWGTSLQYLPRLPCHRCLSALKGEITDPRGIVANDKFPYHASHKALRWISKRAKTVFLTAHGIMLMWITSTPTRCLPET